MIAQAFRKFIVLREEEGLHARAKVRMLVGSVIEVATIEYKWPSKGRYNKTRGIDSSEALSPFSSSSELLFALPQQDGPVISFEGMHSFVAELSTPAMRVVRKGGIFRKELLQPVTNTIQTVIHKLLRHAASEAINMTHARARESTIMEGLVGSSKMGNIEFVSKVITSPVEVIRGLPVSIVIA